MHFLRVSACLLHRDLSFQTGYISFGRGDAGGEWEQLCCPPGEAEEEVSQSVHPQDQQHRTGPFGPAERHTGGAGNTDSH